MKWTLFLFPILLSNFIIADEILPLVDYFNKLIQHLGYKNLTDELDKLADGNNSINGSDLIEKLANAVKTKFNSTKQALLKLKNAIETNKRFWRWNKDDPQSIQEFFDCCDKDISYHKPDHPSEDYKYPGCHLYNSGEITTLLSDNAKTFYKEASEVMKEYLVNKKEQISSNFFYATVHGAFYLYPARKLESCGTFDPRKRSWYAESSTLHAKDVVIAIDVSGSMDMINIQGQSLLDIVKIGASMVVNTLNVNDRVGIVAFSNDVVIPADFECYNRELAVATPQNKQCINKFINSLTGKDLTNYVVGLEKAFVYFNSSPPTEEHRDRILLFLSDGMPTVGGEWENISKIIEKNCVHRNITLLTYGIGKALQDEQNKQLLTKMAANCPGEKPDHELLTEITSPNDMQNSIANYYLGLHMYKNREDPIFTLPYLDAGGLGLILSMCLPVQNAGKFIGVVCTDIQIADLLDDVINFHQGKMSYAFLINNHGQTYFHPSLPTPSSLNENAGPVQVDIDALERDPAIREIIKSMKRGEKGKRQLETQRTVSHGSTQTEGIEVIWAKTEYVWAPISGYNFSVCLVIAADEQFVTLPDKTVTNFIYHNFRKQENFDQQYFQNGICKRNEKIVYNRHSGIKFAPALYKNPIEYRKSNESSMNITEIDHFLKNMTNESIALETNVRAAVAFTDNVESTWKKNNFGKFIWRYVSTFDGVFRLFPATKLNKNFDPRKCPWFQRALNNKDVTILTSPYLDNLGSGYIVSIGRAVCKKECKPYDIQNPVSAVVGGDLSIHFLHSQLSYLIPECQKRNRCILIDHSAYIVMHDDFVFPKSAKPPPIQLVHLSVKEPNITRILLKERILRIKACMDILSIKNKYYWQVRSAEVRRFQDFTIYPVPGTNVFLIIKTRQEDIHTYSCDLVTNFITGMAPTRSYQEGRITCNAAWEYGEISNCSCSSPANFDPCPNTFDYRQLSDLWPTCVPGTQHIDMSSNQDKDIAQYPECKVDCQSQTNSSDCYKMEGCLWCLINKDGKSIEKPFCAQSSYCYYGIVGHTGPYGEKPYLSKETSTSDSSLTVILSVAITIFILVIILVAVFYLYKRKKIYLPKKKEDKSQLLGCTLRTSIIDMERDNPSMVWGNLLDKTSTVSSQEKEQICLRKINHAHSASSDSIAYLAQKVEALVHRLDSAQGSPFQDISFQPGFCSSRHSRRCNRPSSIPSEFSTLPRSTSFTSALSSRSSTMESINSCNLMPPSVSSTLPRSTLHLAPFPEEQILDPISLLSNQISIPTERTCTSCACRQPSERTWPPYNSSAVDVRNSYVSIKREPSERSYHAANKSDWQDLKRDSTCSVCRSSSLPSYGRRSNASSIGLFRNTNAVIRRRRRTSQIHSNRSSSSSSQLAAAAAINSLIQKSLEAVANEQETTENEKAEENSSIAQDENRKEE